MFPHGDRRTYKALRCRCLPCRAANATYVRSRRAGVLYPDPSERVDAVLAELHLTKLKGQGVGVRQAAKLAGLGDRLIALVRSGQKTQIRADTQARILAIPAILAHGQTVMGWRTWRLIDSLKREEIPEGDIATRLGCGPRLRIRRRKVRVLTALKVRALYRHVNAEVEVADAG